MTLPAPVLDDRTFQDIVDEAKRLIPRYCPDWTDHNVADPGVALIELLAWMSESVIYRLNQVPDRLYVKFLELMGIQPFPATPARTDLLFRLTAPPGDPVRIPRGTQVATDEPADDDPVVFTTVADLVLRRPQLCACLARGADGTLTDVWDGLRTHSVRATCFPTLRAGDALYLGFADPLPGHLLQVDVATSTDQGAGIDPADPPRVWQAWNGTRWVAVPVLSDSSGGFDSSGSIALLLPPEHPAMPLGQGRAHWLRCRLVDPRPGQHGYDRSPELETVEVACLGGATAAQHAEPVGAELLGLSNGEPHQVFQVGRTPVLPRRPDCEHVRIVPPSPASGALTGDLPPGTAPAGDDWTEVADFTDTEGADRVYVWSATDGRITFAPRVRHVGPREQDADGGRSHGAVPPAGAQVWVTGYRVGGGRRGNVGARTLTAMRTSIPSVDTVTNLGSAAGGVDAETVEEAKIRGPLELRGGNRAVTARDFERLTLRCARGVARARCIAPLGPGEPVRVLVVPRVDVPPDRLELTDLALSEELGRLIADNLEEYRLLTVRVLVGTPTYRAVSVAAQVRAREGMRPETVQAACENALYRYLNPVVGGPAGDGWPFDRDVNIGEVFALLDCTPGVASVDDVILSGADLRRPPGSRVLDERLGTRVRLLDGALVMSCEHTVKVVS